MSSPVSEATGKSNSSRGRLPSEHRYLHPRGCACVRHISRVGRLFHLPSFAGPLFARADRHPGNANCRVYWQQTANDTTGEVLISVSALDANVTRTCADYVELKR